MKFDKKQYLFTIRALKIAIKLLILFLVAGLIYLANRHDPSQQKLERKPKAAHFPAPEVKIENPVLHGADQSGNRYDIHSKEVHSVEENVYHMDYVNGSYHLKNINLDFNSKYGTVDNKKHSVQLEDDVVMDYDQYHMTTDKIDIDMNNKTAFTDKGAKIKHLNSEIESRSVHVDINKGILDFDGNVTTHIKVSDFK